MSYVPVKDPATGMITMVKAGSRGRAAAAFWTEMVGAPIPSDDMPAEARSEALDAIAIAVFGSGDVNGAIGFQIEMYAADDDEAAAHKALMDGYAATAREAHSRLVATWTGETDNERLSRAFAEMNAVGIVARENLGESLSDGEYMIDGIVDAMIARGVTPRGNVFYHAQDLERALVGGGLDIAFTGDRTGAEAARLIGHEVVGILERNGLKPSWNSNPNHRLKVDMEWRRRP